MATAAAPRVATYEDLCAVPDHKVAEILNGVLHVNPRPASRHARASSVLGSKLGGPPGGWLILDEPELHLSQDVLVPDLAGWRRARMPVMPDAAFFTMAPHWVCEVLSPSTAAVDRSEKLPIYAREGVSYAWLVDPRLETLEVYALAREAWMLLGTWKGNVIVGVKPFDEVPLELGALWER